MTSLKDWLIDSSNCFIVSSALSLLFLEGKLCALWSYCWFASSSFMQSKNSSSLSSSSSSSVAFWLFPSYDKLSLMFKSLLSLLDFFEFFALICLYSTYIKVLVIISKTCFKLWLGMFFRWDSFSAIILIKDFAKFRLILDLDSALCLIY